MAKFKVGDIVQWSYGESLCIGIVVKVFSTYDEVWVNWVCAPAEFHYPHGKGDMYFNQGDEVLEYFPSKETQCPT